MSDIFESVSKKYRGSAAAVVLFLAAFTMFAIGANHFVEDTVSSKIGLETLQVAFDLKVQIFQWSYWTMSLAPQVASIVFFYTYLSDTSRKDFLFLSFASQAVDFFADSWYRSNGNLFEDGMVFAISAVITFAYFTIGSEVFVTVGMGLILKLAAPALQTWKVTWENIKKARNMNYSPDGGGGNNGQQGGGKRDGGVGAGGRWRGEPGVRHPEIRPELREKLGKGGGNGGFHMAGEKRKE